MKPVILTPRQLQVARLLNEDRTYKEIAAALGISERTVEFHAAELRRRTGARSNVAAVSRARARAASAHARPT